MAEGTLFLIVGPSGVGKDTLIDGARAALAGDPGFVFARRVITRPAGSGGEDHRAATEEEFRAHEESGGFMIAWRAHGLSYGLEKSLKDDLTRGRYVIANVSRAILDDLVARFSSHCIVEITAAPEILAERLADRGRESAPEIAERLALDAMNRIIDSRGRNPAPPEPGPLRHEVPSPASGVIGAIDCWRISGIARRAGAPLDKTAGIDLLKQIADPVAKGEPLYRIHAGAGAGFAVAVDAAEGDNGFDIEPG